MPIFKRLIQLPNGQLISDPENPLLNQYSANFFHFEQGVLIQELEQDDEIEVILLPDRRLKAVLPNGQERYFG